MKKTTLNKNNSLDKKHLIKVFLHDETMKHGYCLFDDMYYVFEKFDKML
jgi:hypothetical protein